MIYCALFLLYSLVLTIFFIAYSYHEGLSSMSKNEFGYKHTKTVRRIIVYMGKFIKFA